MFGNFGNCSIPNFPKITKKWCSTRTSKTWKTCFDSKTDSKVWNAGPYFEPNPTLTPKVSRVIWMIIWLDDLTWTINLIFSSAFSHRWKAVSMHSLFNQLRTSFCSQETPKISSFKGNFFQYKTFLKFWKYCLVNLLLIEINAKKRTSILIRITFLRGKIFIF